MAARLDRRSPDTGSIGLVHDYLLAPRGAERVFAAIAECWPQAPIYTLLYDRRGTNSAFAQRDVHTSYLQRLGLRQTGFRALLPFFPRAVEHLPLDQHELVISSSSAFAHGVRPAPGAAHVSYCHTPFRYCWNEHAVALDAVAPPLRPVVRRMLRRIREWDVEASSRVTHYIANSEITRKRIQDFYGRDAVVIHPPVDVERFSIGEPEDFFLVVGELVRHKRVGNAIEAARRAGRSITVVGTGPMLKPLRREYGDTARFVGRVPDSELASLYRRALAVVVPNTEEFGIAAVEAQAAGRPVLGTSAGGALETVVPAETGVLVAPNDVDDLAGAMRETDWNAFEPARIRAHATLFSTENFKRRFTDEVARVTGSSRPPAPNPLVDSPDGVYPRDVGTRMASG